MDTNTLIELAAKMVEALGMLADNQDRIAQNIRPTYGGRAFREMAEEMRGHARPIPKIVGEYDPETRTYVVWEEGKSDE